MKVAVVGSGVSGLAATWLLNGYSEHEVHLYEADGRPGGHANTVEFKRDKQSSPVDVDTGFIVFNPSTYPNFLRFLSLYPQLKNAILPTEMTFSVSRDEGAFEWAGKGLRSFFAQPARILDRKMWRLLYDIVRFNACARRLIMKSGEKDGKKETDAGLSIGEYLDREGYSDVFRDNYLIPMTAAIWSTSPDKCSLDFPARTLIQFLNNHHLLQLTGKPAWLTLHGGSQVYVKQILSTLPPSQLHLNKSVRSVKPVTVEPPSSRGYGPLELRFSTGETEQFDHVIFASHSDDTLRILREGGGLTTEEERILGSFRWNRNEAVLHSDVKLMPKSRIAWSCWNYLTCSEVDKVTGKKKANVDRVSLTYWMNDLQHISEEEHGPVLVTLNPPFEPELAKVAERYKYDHPVLDSKAISAQHEMPTIQNTRGISYAGAWLKYGFHEDGFTSGLKAALAIGGDIHPPFDVREVDREPQPLLAAALFDFVEQTGVRRVVGAVIGVALNVIASVVLMTLSVLA